MREFGFTNPVLIDDENDGMAEVPCVELIASRVGHSAGHAGNRPPTSLMRSISTRCRSRGHLLRGPRAARCLPPVQARSRLWWSGLVEDRAVVGHSGALQRPPCKVALGMKLVIFSTDKDFCRHLHRIAIKHILPYDALYQATFPCPCRVVVFPDPDKFCIGD
jgi:hypothetical protein